MDICFESFYIQQPAVGKFRVPACRFQYSEAAQSSTSTSASYSRNRSDHASSFPSLALLLWNRLCNDTPAQYKFHFNPTTSTVCIIDMHYSIRPKNVLSFRTCKSIMTHDPYIIPAHNIPHCCYLRVHTHPLCCRSQSEETYHTVCVHFLLACSYS